MGTISVETVGGGGNVQRISNPAQLYLQNGQWYRIVAMVVQSGEGRELVFEVNGVERNRRRLSNSFAYFSEPTKVTIGDEKAISTLGDIDEIRVWYEWKCEEKMFNIDT